MVQNIESGRHGNEVGLIIGKEVAKQLGILLEQGSNKGTFRNRKVVIKSARLGNSQFGITNRMLNDVQDVILAKESSINFFELYLVDIIKLGSGRPTSSKGSSAGRVTSFSVTPVISEGVLIGSTEINLPYPPNNQ